MDKKQHILSEIKRTAEKNGGRPLGKKRFSDTTGIKETEWYGKPWNEWNSWGDALKEAGYAPNQMQEAYDEDFLIQSLIMLTRKLGRFPVDAELRRETSLNANFPTHTIWVNRLGSKNQRITKVIAFCQRSPDEYQDILMICEPLIKQSVSDDIDISESDGQENFGYVYLMKSGKYYKIGYTNSPDRRQYEIGMQLAEKLEPIHSINTDDPSGIEAYWHNRFKGKRLNGEWFNLTASDVKAFKKRRFM